MAAAIIDESKKPRTPPPLPTVGPDMARMMKVGTRVIRGPDWKWGDQVCKHHLFKVHMQSFGFYRT